MKSKYSFQYGEAKKVENQNLDCFGCVLAYPDRVSDCIAFHQKPISVLKGNDCPKKQIAKTGKK